MSDTIDNDPFLATVNCERVSEPFLSCFAAAIQSMVVNSTGSGSNRIHQNHATTTSVIFKALVSDEELTAAVEVQDVNGGCYIFPEFDITKSSLSRLPRVIEKSLMISSGRETSARTATAFLAP
jgi:hypothetical protein